MHIYLCLVFKNNTYHIISHSIRMTISNRANILSLSDLDLVFTILCPFPLKSITVITFKRE